MSTTPTTSTTASAATVAMREALIPWLLGLVARNRDTELAMLADGAGENPRETVTRCGRFLLPALPREAGGELTRGWAVLDAAATASLFAASHAAGGPLSDTPPRSLAASLATYARRGKRERQQAETMLTDLLSLSDRDLLPALASVVRRLAQARIALDWGRLFEDIAGWGHPGLAVQAQWSIEYWMSV